MRTNFRSRRRQAFTLVELLVVVAIIAIMIAMLLPALKKVKEAANAIKCMAHEKQIMMATMMYIQENKGALPLPPSIADYYPGSDPETRSLMYYMSNSAPSGAGIIRYDVGALWPYLGRSIKVTPSATTEQQAAASKLAQVMNCPSDTEFRAVRWGSIMVDASWKRNFSYSWNSQLRLGQDSALDICRKVSQIKAPGHKILLIEEWLPNDGMSWILRYDPDDVPAFRHNGKGNYGFADGHVETLTPRQLGFSENTNMNVPVNIVDINKARYYFHLTKEK